MNKLIPHSIIIWVVLVYVYLLGGSLQFFTGFSYTISTMTAVTALLLIYGLYTARKTRIQYNKLIQAGIFLILYIQLTGLINETPYIKTILYCFFVIIPISVYLSVIFLVSPELQLRILKYFFLLVGLLQLPILLIQNFGYDFLIKFQSSKQVIEPIDFNFGTFFLKDDHGLCFFLLCLIFFLWLDERGTTIKHRSLLTIYFSLSVFLTNSTISHLLLSCFLLYLLYSKLKPKIWAFILFSSAFIIGLALVFNSSQFQNQVDKSLKTLSYQHSVRNYERGIANRQQTIVVLIHENLKWLGEGPYTYFNILTSTFYQAPNFSQWLWLYFDIGLIGMLLFSLFLKKFAYKLQEKTNSRYLLLGLLVVYAMFTTVTNSLSFMFTYFLFYHRPASKRKILAPSKQSLQIPINQDN